MALNLLELFIIFLFAAFVFTKILDILPQRFMKNYGQLIAKARKSKGLTAKQLAEILKTDEEAIKQIESEKKFPTNELAREIEKHLGIIVLRFNTFGVFTLVKTTSISIFDKFKKHAKILNFISDSGLLLGFGTIAVDRLIASKKNFVVRLLFLIFSFVLLFFLFNALLLGFLVSPFIAEYNTILAASFGLAGFSGFVVVSLFAYASFIIKSILAGEQVCPGIAPLIPGVELPNVPIVLPVHAWLSFLIILLVHEGMHGVLARKNNYKVKSAGLLLFGFLPVGAFVEPDEEEIKKGKEREALRIFSAGAAANLFAAVFLVITIFLFLLIFFVPFIAPWQNGILKEGIEHFVVSDVKEKVELCGKIYPGPAFGVLREDSKILAVNGQAIEIGKLLDINPKQPVVLTVLENGRETEKTIVPTEVGHLGFSIAPKYKEGFVFPETFQLYRIIRDSVSSFLFWLIILNFLVAIVNFLPIDPFDGGRIAKILLYPYFSFLKMDKEETQKLIGRVLLWIIAIVMIINAVPLFL